MKKFLAAFKIRKEIGDKKGIAGSYNNLGTIYWSQGNYPEALQNHLASLKIREDIGNKNGIADSYSSIGLIYANQGNYPEALKNHLASLRIYEAIGNKQGLANAYNNIANIYSYREDYTDALKNYLVSLKIEEEIENIQGVAITYNNIGIVYINLKNYPEAQKNYLSSLKISEEIGDKEVIATNYINLGILNIKLNKPAEAQKYLDKSLPLAKEIGNKDILKDVYDSQTNLDSLQGNFKGAYENHKTYILYRDSLINEENKEKILRQQMQYDFDKKEDFLKYHQQLTDVKLKQQTLITKQQHNIFIAGAIAIFLLAFFIYRTFQNQQKLNKLYRVSAEKQMAELQLQSLRAQLNPHFMFNSLNAIQELIVMEENEKSQSYLERFAQLLRQLLDNANEPFVPLKKEINFLDLYLSRESLRIPDIQYSIIIDASIDADKFIIPNMILQPFIENALWHGLQHKKGEKKLQVHISRLNESILYQIRDNGVGRTKANELKSLYRKEHRSKGMELLSKRLNLLSREYGQQIQTTVTDLTENGNVTGTLVEITVPVALSEQKSLAC